MKKLSFIAIILILGIISASGQPCPDSLYITSQAQIDSFQIMYPNCTEIEGDVYISGSDITNLNGLSVLTSIGGNLTIYDNDALTSLTGLEGVTTIWGSVKIESNSALTSLSGLDNVTSIGGNLSIQENPSLTSLTGLEGLTSIGGFLRIWGNYALTSLTGLENITSIGIELWIAGNAALTSLSGLEGLTSIGGDLLIWYNEALTSLTGLDNVTSIGGNLSIQENPSLTSLTGLENIEAESIENLIIWNNPYLSHCSVLSICNYLSNPNGSIEIDNNTTGCDSPEEVQDSCIANGVNIDEQFVVDKLLIYPNPSSTQITIELPHTQQKNTILTIYNLNGQQLITQKITEQKTVVDVSALPSGVYFVKVVDTEMVMVGKIVVE